MRNASAVALRAYLALEIADVVVVVQVAALVNEEMDIKPDRSRKKRDWQQEGAWVPKVLSKLPIVQRRGLSCHRPPRVPLAAPRRVHTAPRDIVPPIAK